MVYVEFVVGNDGKVLNAKVLRSIGDGCNEEALRIVNMFADREPAQRKDVPVA